jgi:hypothetical protein
VFWGGGDRIGVRGRGDDFAEAEAEGGGIRAGAEVRCYHTLMLLGAGEVKYSGL